MSAPFGTSYVDEAELRAKANAVISALPLVQPFIGSWFEECEHEAEEWLIEGMIPKRSYVLAYGRRGAAKSFFGIHVANTGACGGRFFGQACERFGTIYCVGEKKSRFGKRVKAWRIASGRDRLAVQYVWRAPNLLDEASVSEFIAFVNALRPEFEARGAPLGMIVLDTLVRAIGGANDSDFEVAGKATEAIQRIVDECGVTVMPLHHMAKSKEADTARGAGIWEDAADAIVRIERPEGEDLRRVQLTKQSDEADGLEWAFKLDIVEVGFSPKGRTITSCVVVQQEAEPKASAKARPPKLSANAQKVLSAHNRLFDDGKAHPAPNVPGVGSNWLSVAHADLRAKAYSIGLAEAAHPGPDADLKRIHQWENTRRKAFRDGLELLEREGILRQEAGFVWDPKQKGVR